MIIDQFSDCQLSLLINHNMVDEEKNFKLKLLVHYLILVYSWITNLKHLLSNQVLSPQVSISILGIKAVTGRITPASHEMRKTQVGKEANHMKNLFEIKVRLTT